MTNEPHLFGLLFSRKSLRSQHAEEPLVYERVKLIKYTDSIGYGDYEVVADIPLHTANELARALRIDHGSDAIVTAGKGEQL
jgi:hypothetical protein